MYDFLSKLRALPEVVSRVPGVGSTLERIGNVIGGEDYLESQKEVKERAKNIQRIRNNKKLGLPNNFKVLGKGSQLGSPLRKANATRLNMWRRLPSGSRAAMGIPATLGTTSYLTWPLAELTTAAAMKTADFLRTPRGEDFKQAVNDNDWGKAGRKLLNMKSDRGLVFSPMQGGDPAFDLTKPPTLEQTAVLAKLLNNSAQESALDSSPKTGQKPSDTLTPSINDGIPFTGKPPVIKSRVEPPDFDGIPFTGKPPVIKSVVEPPDDPNHPDTPPSTPDEPATSKSNEEALKEEVRKWFNSSPEDSVETSKDRMAGQIFEEAASGRADLEDDAYGDGWYDPKAMSPQYRAALLSGDTALDGLKARDKLANLQYASGKYWDKSDDETLSSISREDAMDRLETLRGSKREVDPSLLSTETEFNPINPPELYTTAIDMGNPLNQPIDLNKGVGSFFNAAGLLEGLGRNTNVEPQPLNVSEENNLSRELQNNMNNRVIPPYDPEDSLQSGINNWNPTSIKKYWEQRLQGVR